MNTTVLLLSSFQTVYYMPPSATEAPSVYAQ